MKFKSGLEFLKHWIYHFLISTKLLISFNLQIILFVLLIDLPRRNKKAFIGVASFIVLFLWTSTILLAKRVIEKGALFHVKMKKVLLLLATFILSYALLYYSIHNYDKDSFYWLIDGKKVTDENNEDDINEDDINENIRLNNKVEKILHEDKNGETGLIGSFVKYFDMIYFTITTMFTGSFGDIIPKSRVLRLIVISQFIIAVLFISILLSKAN
jgi:hypothetical protein